jgi:hypothetical protein
MHIIYSQEHCYFLRKNLTKNERMLTCNAISGGSKYKLHCFKKIMGKFLVEVYVSCHSCISCFVLSVKNSIFLLSNIYRFNPYFIFAKKNPYFIVFYKRRNPSIFSYIKRMEQSIAGKFIKGDAFSSLIKVLIRYSSRMLSLYFFLRKRQLVLFLTKTNLIHFINQ